MPPSRIRCWSCAARTRISPNAPVDDARRLAQLESSNQRLETSVSLPGRTNAAGDCLQGVAGQLARRSATTQLDSPWRVLHARHRPLTWHCSDSHNSAFTSVAETLAHATQRERSSMRTSRAPLCAIFLVASTSVASAAGLQGDYVEARTAGRFHRSLHFQRRGVHHRQPGCDGVESQAGVWQGTDLSGLCVAAAVRGTTTFSEDQPAQAAAVLIVDQKASPRQREALVRWPRSWAAPGSETWSRSRPLG